MCLQLQSKTQKWRPKVEARATKKFGISMQKHNVNLLLRCLVGEHQQALRCIALSIRREGGSLELRLEVLEVSVALAWVQGALRI